MNELNKKAWRGFIFLALVMGLLLFVPAGTLQYWQAWTYLTIYFGVSLVITIYLMKNNPALLARRLRAGPAAEKETTQKIIMSFASILFVALLVVPALDHRFGWSNVPPAGVLLADILVVLGLFIIFLVYKENPFTAATIQVEEEQKVITTGPYAIVRHPMYSGGLLMLLATPPALGSWWGLLVFLPLLPMLIWRMLDEEKFLSTNLSGYTEYCNKVRSRLIPRIY
ncbi:MAG TPA: isoprenylcysteine carboxylmethyltransferase family protein [Dissulfurispiraceae bacterium]|nr:isoprenylcysteine carboxylmethyltransferase family protein [Dissulfurispiraceae bacterium]